ncbi:MAG: MgtC/SapB family protein [Candidatus Omnitrophica bacterium]|nr:MgtC/SapB family protein [Candidatus Omnitrophota bacterium]
MHEYDMILRLVLAAVLGMLIGLEREWRGQSAGLRTHTLVAIGSALVMVTNLYLFEKYAGRANMDPTRMAAQVVSGIGFLGAGTIMRYGANVRGLTTAASI